MKIIPHAFVVALLTLSGVIAAEAASTAADGAATPPYPLTICVVSGDKLNGPMGTPVVEHYNGEEVQFCCKDCVKDFQKDPEKYMKRLHDAKAKQQVASGQ